MPSSPTFVNARLVGNNIDFSMEKNLIYIGRNSNLGEVDLHINLSSYISRKHCIIYIDQKDAFILECLGKNGIFVDSIFQHHGVPVLLKDRCQIRFPSTTISLVFYSPQGPGRAIDHVAKVVSDPKAFGRVYFGEKKTEMNNREIANVGDKLANSEQSGSIANARPRAPPHFANLPTRFISAPPSPTGTISAVNSAPGSPRSAHLRPGNVKENLQQAMEQLSQQDTRELYVNEKPPYSYAQLIIQAIMHSPTGQLTLANIYAYISENYPYFKCKEKGWQNSIRHNLSLGRCFLKIPRNQDESGKGSFWRIADDCWNKVTDEAYKKRRTAQRSSGSSKKSSSTLAKSAPTSPDRSIKDSPLMVPGASSSAVSSAAHHEQNQFNVQLQHERFLSASATSSPVLQRGVSASTIFSQPSTPLLADNNRFYHPNSIQQQRPQAAFNVTRASLPSEPNVVRYTQQQQQEQVADKMVPQQQQISRPPTNHQQQPLPTVAQLQTMTCVGLTPVANTQPITTVGHTQPITLVGNTQPITVVTKEMLQRLTTTTMTSNVQAVGSGVKRSVSADATTNIIKLPRLEMKVIPSTASPQLQSTTASPSQVTVQQAKTYSVMAYPAPHCKVPTMLVSSQATTQAAPKHVVIPASLAVSQARQPAQMTPQMSNPNQIVVQAPIIGSGAQNPAAIFIPTPVATAQASKPSPVIIRAPAVTTQAPNASPMIIRAPVVTHAGQSAQAPTASSAVAMQPPVSIMVPVKIAVPAPSFTTAAAAPVVIQQAAAAPAQTAAPAPEQPSS